MLTPVSDEPLFACPQFVTNLPFIVPRLESEVKVPLSADSKALPLEWLLDPDKKGSPTDRILARIVQSIAHEPDVWLRDDYRQTFVCVSLAERGNPSPFIQSSYVCYGCHPDQLWARMLAKREAKLGREYSEWYDQAGNLKADICGGVEGHADEGQVRHASSRTRNVAQPETARGKTLMMGRQEQEQSEILSDVLPSVGEAAQTSQAGIKPGPQINISQQDPTRKAVLPMGITQPGGLQLTVADTDSSMGCRIESGETGVRTASGGQSTIQRRHDPENSHDSSSPDNSLPAQLEKKPSDSVHPDIPKEGVA